MKFAVGGGGLRFEVSGLRGILTLFALALVGLGIADQLKRPSGERTWHGKIWGVIPYDFRVPSLEKLARSMWDPGDERVLKDRAFGVGWDLNLGAVAKAPDRR